MRWVAPGIGAAAALAALSWALVTTGHWPLDDRRQPATAMYAANGAMGRWLLDHGGDLSPAAGRAPAGSPGASPPTPIGLTPAELAAAQQALRTDPRFQGRRPYTAPPASTGRG